MKNLISKSVRDELVAVQKRIGQIETELESLDEQRFRLQSAPVSRAEALALVDEEIERLAREGRARVFANIRSAARGGSPDLQGMLEHQTAEGRKIDTRVLVTILAPAIRSVAEAMVNESETFSDNTFTAEQRAKQLAKVDEKIEKLEAERQALIGELREAGFDVTDQDEVEPEPADAD